MQAALQFFEHKEQLRHLSLSNCIFIHEYRDRKLSVVPTGQMVLQYVRPLRQASMKSMISVTAAIMSAGRLRIHSSLW